MPRELTAAQVRRRCDPALFKCNSTGDLEPLSGIIGQERAMSALNFGLNILKPGFNVYVSGSAGTGRTTTIKSFLETLAAKKETPSDWCYVHNFRDSYYPKTMEMPAGMGQTLQKDVNHLVDNARRSLIQAFASKEHAERRAEITADFHKKRDAVFSAINKKAEENGLLLQTTPVGIFFIPSSRGEAMSEEEYKKLSARDKEDLRKKQEELSE
ncbi:MAG: Lon-like protease helical domain-containing protein, partial [Dehalococcoidales bacterium]|nr:Lon-like protease helical domain-containing protein [Dehalococcoidales bacterium]